MKGFVKIAYWDTGNNEPVPQILGQIKGTPTIKLVKPKRKGKNNKQKQVIDYNLARTADELSTFAFNSMPSFVERVNSPEDYEKIQNKANKFGLPLFIAFSGRNLNEFKYLSTEFRRRVLITQIGTKKELKELYFKFGVMINGKALLVVPPSEDEDVADSSQRAISFAYDKKWTLNSLQTFFDEHALSTEVKPKPKEETKKEDPPGSEEKKQEVKTEKVKTEKVKTEL